MDADRSVVPENVFLIMSLLPSSIQCLSTSQELCKRGVVEHNAGLYHYSAIHWTGSGLPRDFMAAALRAW
jgi:hypothetical protein